MRGESAADDHSPVSDSLLHVDAEGLQEPCEVVKEKEKFERQNHHLFTPFRLELGKWRGEYFPLPLQVLQYFQPFVFDNTSVKKGGVEMERLAKVMICLAGIAILLFIGLQIWLHHKTDRIEGKLQVTPQERRFPPSGGLTPEFKHPDYLVDSKFYGSEQEIERDVLLDSEIEKALKAFEEFLKNQKKEEGYAYSSESEDGDSQNGEEEGYDYSEYDKLFYNREVWIGNQRFIWNLPLVGVPIPVKTYAYKLLPTPEDRKRMAELEREAELYPWKADELYREYKKIYNRSIRKVVVTGYDITNMVGKILPDGTVLEYRRVPNNPDGQLVRIVKKPDGEVLIFPVKDDRKITPPVLFVDNTAELSDPRLE